MDSRVIADCSCLCNNGKLKHFKQEEHSLKKNDCLKDYSQRKKSNVHFCVFWKKWSCNWDDTLKSYTAVNLEHMSHAEL